MAMDEVITRRTRRGVISTAGATLSAAFLAACGGAGPASESTAGGAAGPASIRVWYNPWTPAIPAWEQTVLEFQAKQPNIQVSAEPVTGGGGTTQEEKILAAVAGGTPPDVTYVHPIANATFAVQGVIVPLDPYLARSKGAFDLRDFYPGAIDYFKWDGKLWCLPNYSGPNVLYYNKDLLGRQGLADPWELYQKGQWTIQTMDDYVVKLTRAQPDGKVFGRTDISGSVRTQSPWIQGFGGEVWNAKVTETLLTGDGAVKAWEYLAGQVTKGYAPASQDLQGVTGGTLGLFKAGRLAFTWGIRSQVPDFKEVPFGATPLHKMPDGKEYNRDGPNGLGITHGSKLKDAGWAFMMFELTRGVELKMGTGFTAPTTRTLAKSPLWLNQLIGGENAKVYEAAAAQVRAIPHPPRMPEIDKLIQEAYTKIKNGQASAKTAMTEVKPQIDAILAQRGQ